MNLQLIRFRGSVLNVQSLGHLGYSKVSDAHLLHRQVYSSVGLRFRQVLLNFNNLDYNFEILI